MANLAGSVKVWTQFRAVWETVRCLTGFGAGAETI